MSRRLITALVLPAFLAPAALPLLSPAADALGMPGVASALSGVGVAHADEKIKRGRIKLRPCVCYPPKTYSVTTEEAGDGINAASAATDLTYTDDTGASVSVDIVATSPKVEKVYFDWTPPADFAGGTAMLGCVDCNDAFSDVPITLDASDGWDGWDGDNEDVGDTALDVRAWIRADGSYRFRLKGKPVDIAALGFAADGLSPDANLTVNGETTAFQFTRKKWQTRVDLPGFVEDEPLIISTEVLDAGGAVLDSSTTVETLDDAPRDGVVLERLKLSETGAGNVKLRADVFSDAIGDTPTLNASVDDDGGSPLVSLSDAPPTKSERQFAATFELVEADNFADLTYLATIDLLNDAGEVVWTLNTIHIAGEGFDVEPLIGADGDWEFALTLTYLNNYVGGDVGFTRVTVAGPDVSDVAGVRINLVPDDGGSDVDPDTFELPFVGAWHAWEATGTAGTGGLGDGGTVSFDAVVAAAGDFSAPLGQVDLNGGTDDDFGAVYRTAGFGKGTKANTAKATARFELE